MLAFGPLSALEVEAMLEGASDIRLVNDRVCTLRLPDAAPQATRLAGIHKFVPLLAEVADIEEDVTDFISELAAKLDDISTLSVSAYGLSEERYEPLARAAFDAVRAAGFRKVKLLRPHRNELMAQQVASRGALDIVAFPIGARLCIGPTGFVPDTQMIRKMGFDRPARRSEISLSPRLASLLVNLAGLAPGQTLLDPFCGAGTILAAGLLRSLYCVGIDSNPARVSEARRNLGWTVKSKGRRFSLRVGDAANLSRHLNRGSVDAVVTEPILLPRLERRPSLKEAEALTERAGKTYASSLVSMMEVLKPGGRIVTVVPVLRAVDGSEVSVRLNGGRLGLRPFSPPGPHLEYPVRPAFESTRWVRRAVYVFEAP